jgi:hypothetical protein
VRVQSDPQAGYLQLFVDNVKLGAGGHRQSNGFFRLRLAPAAPSPSSPGHEDGLRVQMCTSIFNAVLRGNVTSVGSGEVNSAACGAQPVPCLL